MVGAGHVVVDVGGDEVVFQVSRHHEVIQSPAHVPLASACHHVPPGVFHSGGMQVAEGVYQSGGEKFVQPRTLFRHEAAGSGVRLGAGQVNLGVGRVEVARNDDGP